jgi:hypothetical protein
MDDSPWNSLEVVKVVIAVLTPLLILGLGLVVNRASKRLEDAQWGNRKLIERRLDIYDSMAPKLNDLFCFFSLKGNFREVSPPAAVKRKRELDKLFFVNRFLFGEQFSAAYFRFFDLCFEHDAAVATDARLRTDPHKQKAEFGSGWDDSWGPLFSPTAEWSSRTEVEGAYGELMRRFADELGVRPQTAG